MLWSRTTSQREGHLSLPPHHHALACLIQSHRISGGLSSSPTEALLALLVGIGLGSLDGKDMAQVGACSMR